MGPGSVPFLYPVTSTERSVKTFQDGTGDLNTYLSDSIFGCLGNGTRTLLPTCPPCPLPPLHFLHLPDRPNTTPCCIAHVTVLISVSSILARSAAPSPPPPRDGSRTNYVNNALGGSYLWNGLSRGLGRAKYITWQFTLLKIHDATLSFEVCWFAVR